MGVIFVAGVYGVGKSTLCKQLSEVTQIPCYSASDLISKVSGEQYGANKAVANKFNNQDILAIEVHKQLKIQPRLLLAGHFCIFTKNNEVDYLPESVYHCLSIEKVLLLEANTEIILKNLSLRDKREYTYEQLFKLQQAERIVANAFTARTGCDFFSYSMRFEETDLNMCLTFIKKGDS